jgi:hypothetical protein
VSRARPALPLALAALALAGCRNGARADGPGLLVPRPEPSPEAIAREATVVVAAPEPPAAPPERRVVEGLSPRDFEEFNRAWVLFVREDPRWPVARDTWLERGGAAPYVLAENLLRYFWSATAHGSPRHVQRVAESAAAAGEPAVGYFARLLAMDSRPLERPVTRIEADGTKKTVTHWTNDDVTRQHVVTVLVAIGPPSVPTLVSPSLLRSPSPAVRRYVAYALGRIATDEAIDAVGSLLSSPDWQERGAAVKALGFGLDRNARAKGFLERAKGDADAFVRKKAEEALSGKVRDDV